MKAKVGLIFSAVPPETKTWPYVGYNYEKRSEEILSILKKSMPEISFITKIIYSRKDVERILDEIGDVDGYVIYFLGIWSGAYEKILEKSKPTIFVDDLYAGSGEFLIGLARARRKGYPVIGIASSKFSDIIETIKLLYVINRLKNSKILVITDRPTYLDWAFQGKHWDTAEKLEKYFGIKIVVMKPEDLNKIYNEVSDEEAEKYFEKWVKKAVKIVEPSRDEIYRAARLHVAIKKAMEMTGANAVTIDCLGLVYGGKLPAYPCLSFVELNNEGFIGTCEADIDSTVTMLMIRYLTNRPSFVSDPVIDLGSNQIIYVHCVAATKIYGFDKVVDAPYILRSHAEDRSGVSVQVLFPPGEKVTTVKLNIREMALAIHSGRTVGNVEEDKGCRTKLAVEGDVDKIFENWNMVVDFGWHRVTVIGDWRKQFINLARLLKLNIIEEDK